MKKYLPIVSVILIVPSVSLASWWNPLDWFGSSSNYNQPSVQQIVVPEGQATTSQQQSSTTEPLPPTVSANDATDTPPTQKASSSANDESKLKAQVSSLTAQNSLLQSRLATTQNQLVSVQNSYAMCQTSLTTAQNTIANTQNQVQQSAAVSPTSTINPPSAVISLGSYTPHTDTFSATNGQYLSLPILTFDIQPSSDQSVSSVTANITSSGQGNINTANLYSAGYGYTNPIATAVVSNGVVIFSNIRNIPSLSIQSSPYNTVMIKVDVSGLKDVGSSESVSASVSNVRLIDSKGQNVDVTGTAQGNVMTVTNDSISGAYPFNLTKQEISTPGTYAVSSGASSYNVTVYPDGQCSQSRGPCTEVGGGWSCSRDGCGG